MGLPKVLESRSVHKDTLEERIPIIITWFVLKHPFFSSIIMSMPIKIEEESKYTAATNYTSIFLSRNHCDRLTNDELKFLFAHELLHVVLMHNFRRGGRDGDRWNCAADVVINQTLIEDGIGTMLPYGINEPELFEKGEGVSEIIYDLIPDQGGGKGMIRIDDCTYEFTDENGNQLSQAEVDILEGQLRTKIAKARAVGKMAGNMTEGVARLVNEAFEPVVNWRALLQRFVVRTKDDSRTWARPNRRLASQGIMSPSQTGEMMGDLAIAIDCSGSIGPDELAQFAGEVLQIWDDNRPANLHIIYFDSEVSHYDMYEKDGIRPQLAFHGGGGTRFSPIYHFMKEKDIEPVALVFLTDLYCDDYGEEPPFPVLWVCTEKQYEQPPFGEVTVMDLEGERR